MSMSISFLFLPSLCAAHRDLHSFPTRRSSDLRGRGDDQVVVAGHLSCPFEVSPNSSVLISSLLRRSEEHTSELQSLRHLVCRLLLEKKNSSLDTQEALALAPLLPRAAEHPDRA